MKHTCTLLVLSAVLLLNPLAQALQFQTIDGRVAQVDILERLVMMTNWKEIIAEMEKTGVKIYRVPQMPRKPQRDANGRVVLVREEPRPKKQFGFVPVIPKNLKTKLSEYLEDAQDEGAVFITWNHLGSENAGNTILLGEWVHPVTLFHEFTHHLFEVTNRKDTLAKTKVQDEFNTFLRIYNFKTGKVLFDRYLLQSKPWREEMDNLMKDVSALATVEPMSEEFAVEEGLMKLLWEKKSPWFAAERAKEGIQYPNRVLNMIRGRLQAVIGLMDMVRTDGENMDPEVTIEEIQRRERLYLNIRLNIESYIEKDIAAAQKAIDSAIAYLNTALAELGLEPLKP